MLADLIYALSGDEHAIALAPVLKEAEAKATRILTVQPKSLSPILQPAQTTKIVTDVEKGMAYPQALVTNIASIASVSTPVTIPTLPKTSNSQIISQATHDHIDLVAVEQLLHTLKSQLKVGQKICINLYWVITEENTES